MNLRFLRTFVAVADNAGFARAAARLNLTQSAASRQIQALEGELGVRLFARVGRNARLTAEGEDLLVRCRRLLSDVAALGERARGPQEWRSRSSPGRKYPAGDRESACAVLASLSQASPRCRGSSRGRWWRSSARPAGT